MADLKSNQVNGSKLVTMSAADIDYLQNRRAKMQAQLDVLLQGEAAAFLNYLAVTKFGMPAGHDYHFEFHPDKEYDNLTITERG